jgi:uncharacterized protein
MTEDSNYLDELDDLIMDVPLDLECMLLGEIDGLIAGVLSLPVLVPSEEWLPLIWDNRKKPFPLNARKSARMIELILARKAEIVGNFIEGGMVYEPIYDVDLDGSPMWEIWLEAFLQGTDLRPDAVLAMASSADEDLATALVGIQILAALANGERLPKKVAGEMIEMAPDMLGYYAETLYRCNKGLGRVIME